MDPLIELEDRLRARPMEPPLALRQRVMGAVNIERLAQLQSRSIWRAPAWSWFAAAAALVMIVINLSFVSASGSALAALSNPGIDAGREFQSIHRIEQAVNASLQPHVAASTENRP